MSAPTEGPLWLTVIRSIPLTAWIAAAAMACICVTMAAAASIMAGA